MIVQIILLLSVFTEVSSRCQCLNKIILLHNSEDYRIISSPNYPRSYCGEMDCLWRIVGPENSSNVYFYADNLDMREDLDRIIFYDGKFLEEQDNATESGSCTGNELCRFASSSDYLTIRFKTKNGDINNYGFQGTVSSRDRPINELISSIHNYCVPLIVLGLIVMGVVVSILCCHVNRQKSKSSNNHNVQNDKLLNA